MNHVTQVKYFMDLEKLKQFLVRAKQATYAAGDKAKTIREVDGSKSLYFVDGDFKYHDNYFGGEPYGGREVVFYQNKPVWMMVYYGRVISGNTSKVYKILQEALLEIEEQSPYRGPVELVAGDYKYVNQWQGEIDNFMGEEIIYQNEVEVYRAGYRGGVVNK